MSGEIVSGLGFKEWLVHETLALAGNYKGGVFQRLVAASYKLAPVSDPVCRTSIRRTGQEDESTRTIS